MDIRIARTDDIIQIHEINKTSLGYNIPLELAKERIEYILKKDCYRIYVACMDEKVVGYIHGGDYDCTYSAPLKNILALAVDEHYQGRGVGKFLLQSIEQWAKEEGSIGVRLVSGFNRVDAHQFYLHCGYHLRKEQKNFIKYFNGK
jgi:GNAT superfamily N-acetyltransferase